MLIKFKYKLTKIWVFHAIGAHFWLRRWLFSNVMQFPGFFWKRATFSSFPLATPLLHTSFIKILLSSKLYHMWGHDTIGNADDLFTWDFSTWWQGSIQIVYKYTLGTSIFQVIGCCVARFSVKASSVFSPEWWTVQMNFDSICGRLVFNLLYLLVQFIFVALS